MNGLPSFILKNIFFLSYCNICDVMKMKTEELCFSLFLYVAAIFSEELMQYLGDEVLHTQLTQILMELLE